MNEFINVTKPFLPPKELYFKKLEGIWERNWLTNNGPLHQEFEEKTKKYLKTENMNLFVNGHLALDLALKTLELEGEVITTPFTFASTVHAIMLNGLTPIFCDIEPHTFNIDVKKIEALITEKTSAIVPVHVFGNPCDVFEIEKIAKKYNLKVIYDAAHTFGVEINGEGIGHFGDLSMFSLHATKVFHSIEGGLLTYKNPIFKKRLEALKNFGITGEETVDFIGINAKMNEFQAAMGLVNLDFIDEQISKRKTLTNAYRDKLKEIEGIDYLDDIKGVKHNYSYFPIIVEKNLYGIDRDELQKKLKENNIMTRKYFYPLCSEFNCYNFNTFNLENAMYVSKNILTLPLYSELTHDEVGNICKIIKDYAL